MKLIKKFVNEAVRGFGYAFGYYIMKSFIQKADNPVYRAKWKRNTKNAKRKFRIRKKEEV